MSAVYTGPRLFTKPIVKTNHVIIQNAIMKCLEGAVNADLLKRMQAIIADNMKSCVHFLILFRNRIQFRGLYSYDEKTDKINKLDGVGPKSIKNVDIFKYYKFDSSRREFLEVQTRNIGLTIIAFTIHDHLWPKRSSHLTQQDTTNEVSSTTNQVKTSTLKPATTPTIITATTTTTINSNSDSNSITNSDSTNE